MKWEYLGGTLIFVFIGYFIGSISFSIIIAKIKFKEDVRTKGSGNAGATNVMRNYGKSVALIVFILDVCKPILAAIITYEFKNNFDGFLSGIIIQAAAFAAVIGHIFPIFYKFKGGKGAACMVGFFITIHWILFFIGFVVFMIIVKKTKMASMGSIFASLILIMFQIAFVFIPHMNDTWSNPISREPHWWANTLFLFSTWSIVVYKHKENIKRILNGTENKTSATK